MEAKHFKQVSVIDEFGNDITSCVDIQFGRVYDEFGCDITNFVKVIVKVIG